MSVTMLKKLGAKQIVGNVKQAMKDYCANDGDKVSLYTIFGIAKSIKTGTGTYGDWVAFQGQFEATNHVDGQSYSSNQAFIVEPVQSLLLTAMETSDSVQFAVTVDVKRRDDLDRGYEYVVTPHMQTKENDPLAHMRETIPKIAAPKKVEQLEAPQEAEKPAQAAPANSKKK